MPQRRCLDCRTLIPTGTRCGGCTRTHRAPKRQADQQRYDQQWRKQSTATRQAWVQQNGWLCPGWATPPHPSTDLVVDHDLGVLCRACNGAKAGGWDKRNPHA